MEANGVDPDQSPRSAVSEMGLHSVPISLKRDARLKWVKFQNRILNLFRLKKMMFHNKCVFFFVFFSLTRKCLLKSYDQNSVAQIRHCATLFAGKTLMYIEFCENNKNKLSRVKRIWYLSPMRAARSYK